VKKSSSDHLIDKLLQIFMYKCTVCSEIFR